jgi:MraZ protein
MAIDSPENRMYGYFEHSIDDKGRIIVPQRFRELLGEEFVVALGPSGCVRAYPIPVWKQVESAFASRTPLDEYDSTTQFLQRMIGLCDFVKIDGQNRVTIPRFLKDSAGLSDRELCAVLGTGSHIEFWRVSALATLQKECDAKAVNAALASRAVETPAGFLTDLPTTIGSAPTTE